MARAKRPASIRWFQRLFYVGLVTAGFNSYLIAVNPAGRAELGEAVFGAMIVVLAVLEIAFNLLLLWLIAYRASNIARWIFIGLVAIGFVFLIADVGHARVYGDLSLALTLAQNLLCAIEIGLLFRRDARDWFAGRVPVDPEIFS
jgi:hypothetical protein